MKDRIEKAFDTVRADQFLLERTTAYINNQRERPPKTIPHFPVFKLVGALAAVFIICAGVYWMYFVPDVYVSLDINPSVELSLNRMNRVISTYAFNQEGEDILNLTDPSGLKYSQAVTSIVATAQTKGYLSDSSLVSLTVQANSTSREQGVRGGLQQSLDLFEGDCAVEVLSVSAQVRNAARRCHMSPAKYLAIEELLEVDSGATMEQYSHCTIPEIRDQTQNCINGHHPQGSAPSQGRTGHGRRQ